MTAFIPTPRDHRRARPRRGLPLVLAAGLLAVATSGFAHGPETHSGGIQSQASEAVQAPFDIVHTKISTAGNVATFHIAVSGKAGAGKPASTGKLAGSRVFSYVWPKDVYEFCLSFLCY